MAEGGHRDDQEHRRRLDRLRNAARRARLLAQPEAPPQLPEPEGRRPELDVFARHLKRHADEDQE